MGAGPSHGQLLQAGDGAGARDAVLGGQLPHPGTRDPEGVEDLTGPVVHARGAQAGGGCDGTRPAASTRQQVGEPVGQEQDLLGARRRFGLLAEVGEQLVRGVDGGRCRPGQFPRLLVGQSLPEGGEGAAGAFVAVAASRGEGFTVRAESNPVDAPGVDAHAGRVGEPFDGQLQPLDHLLPDQVEVPTQVAVAHRGGVRETVHLGLGDAVVVQYPRDHPPGGGTKVYG